MDRMITKKRWPKIVMFTSAGIVLLSIILYMTLRTADSRLNVKAERITISLVEKGPFQEYIAIVGKVLPQNTIYLDAVEGGRVEEIFLEAGSIVKGGDPILRLSNTNLLLDIMYREAELFQQSNNLRNTRLSLEQNRLRLNQELAEVDFRLQQARRRYERNEVLFEGKFIPAEKYEDIRDEYEYMQKKKELTVESMDKELSFRKEQIRQLEASLQRMKDNLEVVKEKQENLTLRAPISGHLTSLKAEIGESKRVGERLGQIDEITGFKVRATVDEHFISRIEVGKSGKFELAEQEYQLTVTKVYPEIRDGRFEVDLEFKNSTPEDIRRGRTLHIKLELGDVSEELLVPRGGFYNKTGGNWIYALDPSGDFAVKRDIRLGMQNPAFFTVLEGLEEGEKVVTSGYDTFGDKDRLVFK
jgi:HlyD family secretion protein